MHLVSVLIITFSIKVGQFIGCRSVLAFNKCGYLQILMSVQWGMISVSNIVKTLMAVISAIVIQNMYRMATTAFVSWYWNKLFLVLKIYDFNSVLVLSLYDQHHLCKAYYYMQVAAFIVCFTEDILHLFQILMHVQTAHVITCAMQQSTVSNVSVMRDSS